MQIVFGKFLTKVLNKVLCVLSKLSEWFEIGHLAVGIGVVGDVILLTSLFIFSYFRICLG